MQNEERNPEKTVMKNSNEYRIGDRLYVEKIKGCHCTEKKGDEYTLWCRIPQRGKGRYLYTSGTGFLGQSPSAKRLYLSENAQRTVESTVRQFDEETSEEVLNYYVKADMAEGKVTLWYRRLSFSTFSALLSYRDNEGVPHKEYFPVTSLEEFIRELSYGLSPSWRDLFPEGKCPVEELCRGTLEGVEANPIYLSAGEAGDELLQKQLKIIYRVASPEDCAWLAAKTGQRVLPALPEEHNKKYYVRIDTIDFDTLRRSGYELLHRPYFAMMGSTHAAYTLNPHYRSGVDAAPKGAETISFEEYLALFAPSFSSQNQV